MAGRSDVKAFNFNQGDSAAVVGPDRTRIRQVVIFGNAAGAVTIKDGSGGADLLVQSSYRNGYKKRDYERSQYQRWA